MQGYNMLQAPPPVRQGGLSPLQLTRLFGNKQQAQLGAQMPLGQGVFGMNAGGNRFQGMTNIGINYSQPFGGIR